MYWDPKEHEVHVGCYLLLRQRLAGTPNYLAIFAAFFG